MHDDKCNPFVAGHERLEMGSVENEQARRCAGSGGRGSGKVIDEGQLAKSCIRFETCEASLALFRLLEDLDLAFQDDEETFPGVAFAEYDLARRVAFLEELHCQPAEEPSWETRKDRSS